MLLKPSNASLRHLCKGLNLPMFISTTYLSPVATVEIYGKCFSDFISSTSLAKCRFGRPELDFLGHRITKLGITPLPYKTASIKEFTRPSTVKGLQEFLGMVNFYHQFAACIMHPLYQAIAGKPKELEWTVDSISAFDLT